MMAVRDDSIITVYDHFCSIILYIWMASYFHVIIQVIMVLLTDTGSANSAVVPTQEVLSAQFDERNYFQSTAGGNNPKLLKLKLAGKVKIAKLLANDTAPSGKQFFPSYYFGVFYEF